MSKNLLNETFKKHLKLLHEHLNINEGYDINKAKSLLQTNPFLKDSADKITDQNLIDIGNGLVFLHLDDTFKHAKLSHAASSELPGSKFNSEYLTDDQLVSLIKEIVKKNVPEEKVENNVRKLKWFNIDIGKEIGLDSVIKKDKLPSNLSSSNYEYKEKIGNVKAIPFILKNPDVAIFDSNNNKITLDNVDKIDTSGTTSYYVVQPLQIVNMPLTPTTKVNLILAVIGDLDDKTRLVSLMTIFPGEADEKLMNKQDYIKAGYVFLKPKNIEENVDLVNEGFKDILIAMAIAYVVLLGGKNTYDNIQLRKKWKEAYEQVKVSDPEKAEVLKQLIDDHKFIPSKHFNRRQIAKDEIESIIDDFNKSTNKSTNK
jgi:hypothetical protein